MMCLPAESDSRKGFFRVNALNNFLVLVNIIKYYFLIQAYTSHEHMVNWREGDVCAGIFVGIFEQVVAL